MASPAKPGADDRDLDVRDDLRLVVHALRRPAAQLPNVP